MTQRAPGAHCVPFYRLVSFEFINWWADFQFSVAWNWRKDREPGGLQHEERKPASEQDIKQRMFRRTFAARMFDYLTVGGPETIQRLAEIGRIIIEGRIDVGRSELRDPLLGFPLKKTEVNGGWVVIETALLNSLAFEHHEAWMAARDEMCRLAEMLRMPDLKMSPRKEHRHWSPEDPHLDPDRGNIYGLAYCFAVMQRTHPDEFAKFMEAALARSGAPV